MRVDAGTRALLVIAAVWLALVAAMQATKPPPVPRVRILVDSDRWICASTAKGDVCRSSRDVWYMITRDECEYAKPEP